MAAAERYADGLMEPGEFGDVVNDMGEAVGEFASDDARLFGGPGERAGDAAMQAACIATSDPVPRSDAGEALGHAAAASRSPGEPAAQAALLHDLFGNLSRSIAFDPSWLTPTVVALAEGIYQDRAFDRMPIPADALQEAGCDSDAILDHCRGNSPHVRGCRVVDLVLGKECASAPRPRNEAESGTLDHRDAPLRPALCPVTLCLFLRGLARCVAAGRCCVAREHSASPHPGRAVPAPLPLISML